MPKPKAPAWLTTAFAEGVNAYGLADRLPRAAYSGANPLCWLAAHDPAKRPCTPGRLERFHFIRRQDVEAAMWAQLPPDGAWFAVEDPDYTAPLDPEGPELWQFTGRDDLILIAAWDPRNGGLSCEQHHRRYDHHQVSLPREQLVVPYSALPSRVIYFGFDYSEGRLLDRFPSEI